MNNEPIVSLRIFKIFISSYLSFYFSLQLSLPQMFEIAAISCNAATTTLYRVFVITKRGKMLIFKHFPGFSKELRKMLATNIVECS